MGHPINIPVKLFQNLTSGFREEGFSRISSYNEPQKKRRKKKKKYNSQFSLQLYNEN